MATVKTSGFTLIELLLVVGLIMIIGTFSVSFFGRFIVQNEVANTRDQLVAAVRKAQLYSMVGKRNSAWGINYSNPTITLYQGTSFATRNSAFDEKITLSGTVSVSGLSDINFARMTGIASTTPTITLSGTGTSKTITINAAGVASR